MRFLSAALALSVCVCSPSIAAAQEANGSPEQAAAITQSTGRVFTARIAGASDAYVRSLVEQLVRGRQQARHER